MSQAFHESSGPMALRVACRCLHRNGDAEVMVAAIPNGTDVWMAVPASPPLRMTIRACLDDRCEECRLPIYRCESEAGQLLRLCASHLRLPN
jgi:hypothetical protein